MTPDPFQAVGNFFVDFTQVEDRDVIQYLNLAEEVWARLEALGCDSAQGWYVSRPMAPEAATVWLMANAAPPATAPPHDGQNFAPTSSRSGGNWTRLDYVANSEDALFKSR